MTPATEVFYRRQLVKALLEEGYDLASIAKSLKVSKDTVYNDVRFLKENPDKLPELDKETQAGVSLTKKTLQEILTLERKGFRIMRDAPPRITKLSLAEGLSGKEMRFGIVSDTHFGSQYQQLTFLHMAYDFFAEKGITTVFHCGDVVEGSGRMYAGQPFEMFLFGADKQLEYVVENYPKKKGITTYFIGGSHDYSFYKGQGFDILKSLARMRDDMVFLGYISGSVEIEGQKIMLMHPSGGCPYARSYRMQKLIEQMASENKPRVLLVGHLHITEHLPFYRNVDGVQVGCFQAQTPYLAGKGLQPNIGFETLTLGVNDRDIRGGLFKVQVDFYPFFIPKENDY